MNIVQGDILGSNAEYIVQQCNCLTVRAHGLSKTLSTRFVHADLYSKRRPIYKNRNLAVPEDRGTPGSGTILTGMPNIVCLFGQWRPGKCGSLYFSKYPESSPPEDFIVRENWFKTSLWSFGNYLKHIGAKKATVAIPYRIGCGLAGGNWETYHAIIKEFEQTYFDEVNLTIYRLK